MNAALYFPFSRCLEDLALKRALLLYDKLLFLDPVPAHVRNDLYLREHRGTKADERLARRWAAAERHYDLLGRHGLVEVIDPGRLLNLDAAEDVIARGIEADLVAQREMGILRRRSSWQVLTRRLPSTVLQGPLGRRIQAIPGRYWDGPEAIVKVPYAVGSSLSLTSALAAGHHIGATLMTDSRDHHELLLARMRSSAANAVPSMTAPSASPYLSQQVALQVISAFVPDDAARRLSFADLIDFREDHVQARQELTMWIADLTERIQANEWDLSLQKEIAAIVRQAQEIAARPARWKNAGRNAAQSAPGNLVSAGFAVLTAALTPGASALSALLAGGGTYSGATATQFINDLRAKRPPEHTAISYLVAAGRRR